MRFSRRLALLFFLLSRFSFTLILPPPDHVYKNQITVSILTPGGYLVRATCLLHRKPETSGAFWQAWNRLHAAMGRKFYDVWIAASQAMESTPRSSSLVENLNSRLRNCLTLRRHLNGSRAWLGLLKFFFNHRRFMRSRRGERIGKSPREAMTGHDHPNWLRPLGLGPLQPRQI